MKGKSLKLDPWITDGYFQWRKERRMRLSRESMEKFLRWKFKGTKGQTIKDGFLELYYETHTLYFLLRLLINKIQELGTKKNEFKKEGKK